MKSSRMYQTNSIDSNGKRTYSTTQPVHSYELAEYVRAWLIVGAGIAVAICVFDVFGLRTALFG